MLKNKNTKKIMLILLAAALTGALAYGIYATSYKNSSSETVETEDTINLDPPTEEEKAETEAHKDKVVDRQNLEARDQTNSPGTKKGASVTISSWPSSVGKSQNVDVSGFVSNVYENGGTCTLSLVKGSQTVSKPRTAMKDAQTTACGFITIKRSSLNPGTWKATIKYSSPTAQGTSQIVSIEVK
jgi:hypothetical protein